MERMGQTRNIQLGSQNLKKTDRLKDLSANGRIILNLCQKKCNGRNGTGFVQFGLGNSDGTL